MLMKSLRIQFIYYIKSLLRIHNRKLNWRFWFDFRLRLLGPSLILTITKRKPANFHKITKSKCVLYWALLLLLLLSLLLCLCRATYMKKWIPRGIRIHWLSAMKAQPENGYFWSKQVQIGFKVITLWSTSRNSNNNASQHFLDLYLKGVFLIVKAFSKYLIDLFCLESKESSNNSQSILFNPQLIIWIFWLRYRVWGLMLNLNLYNKFDKF